MNPNINFNFQYRVVGGVIHSDPQYSYNEKTDSHSTFFQLEYTDPRDKRKTTDIYNCVSFGKTAQAIDTNYKAGDVVVAEGQNRQFVKTLRDGTTTTEENFVVIRVTKMCSAYNANGMHDTFDTQEIKIEKGGGFNGFMEEFGDTYTGRRGRRF